MLKKIRVFAQNIYDSILAEPFALDIREVQLLAFLYPKVDWSKVRYFKGLPWFAKKGFASAMAIPSTYTFNHVHIHFKEFDPKKPYQLVTLVHEAFHVLQYHETKSMNSYFAFGFFRKFLRWYLAWYFRRVIPNIFRKRMGLSDANYDAYRYHVMETPAYSIEPLFGESLTDYYLYPCKVYEQQYARLIQEDAAIESPTNPVLLFLSMCITLSIAIIKPILESIALLFAVLLGAKTWKSRKKE
ncbi:MAG: hypothetical protein MK212_19055 [Saprospiraceae bacterium]|nr:hypothetical protein [Saprospiraceae bacterium]